MSNGPKRLGLSLLDGWRLAVGTLTAVPVRAPAAVDRTRGGIAMVLAPVAVLPIGLALAAVVLAGHVLGLPDLVGALLGIGIAILGNRAFHLDGLSDTVDGMAASFDRERSLEVMKGGTAGPAGVVALVLVIGLQVAALSAVVSGATASGHLGWVAYNQFGDYLPADKFRPVLLALHAAVLAGVALCVSRGALVICCMRGIRPAREDGLGRTFTQSVPRTVAVAVWLVIAAIVAAVGAWAGLPWWRGVLAAALAAVAVGLVVLRAVSRFGGVTGDVFGAAVEIAFATLLVALS